MSLFNRKTVLDDGIESLSVNNISFGDVFNAPFKLGGEIIGSLTGANQAADAAREGARLSADATLQATEKNIDFQKWLWGEQKDITQPYVNAGERALTKYQREIDKPFGLNELQLDPGYNFRLSEGLKAVENSAAARGMGLSGGALKDISRWSQSLASDEFSKAYQRRQDYLNRLSGLVGTGQASAVGQAQQGGAMGAQVSNSILTGGQALANMYSNIGNINAAQAMAPFNTLMDIGGLAASYYGAKSGAAPSPR